MGTPRGAPSSPTEGESPEMLPRLILALLLAACAAGAPGNLRGKMPGAPLTKQGRCVACRRVATAVGTALDNEKPHEDIDSHKPIHTDAGERLGKRTSYAVSELRAMNIMEGLCESVSRPEGLKWVTGPINPQSPKSSILKLVPQAERVERQPDAALQVSSYCDRVLEEQEEVLINAIRSGHGSSELESLEDQLCVNAGTKACINRDAKGLLRKPAKGAKSKRQKPSGKPRARQIHDSKSELQRDKKDL